MRALAFNHFFDQDLAALRARMRPDESLVEIPYQRLHRLARRSFPAAAFTGVEPAMAGDHRDAWRAYQPRAHRFADWLLAAHRPVVFVVPTDAIFYLRPIIERFRVRGVPTVVAQKETTISPMVMQDHAVAVGRSVPFMSAHMTVCSERQKEFWVRSGAPAEAITVTGQPRFDVYATGVPGGDMHRRKPRLLFLSYDDAAYLPSDTGLTYDGDWQTMRLETETALQQATTTWDVVVKEHPQQTAAPTVLGPEVQRAARDADTRRLILEADAIVGFQTTALFEAAAAGKPVVYAAWGPEEERARHLLIPFHEHPELVMSVHSGSELEGLLQRGPSALAPPSPGAASVIAEHIGPVDGLASERTIEVIRRIAARTPPPRGRLPLRRALRAGALAAAAPPLSLVAGVAARSGQNPAAMAIRRRATDWRTEGRELRSVSRQWAGRSRAR